MRITSGMARGHRIRMPSGPEIRPTQDMTRKAVFDILGREVEGRRFLDLFAGTGANGIEALSRGADCSTFVDNSKFCVEVINKNLESTRLADNASVIRDDVLRFLQLEYPEEQKFDIVFADPPYFVKVGGPSVGKRVKKGIIEGQPEEPLAERTLNLLSAGTILGSHAWVIIEHSPETCLPDMDGKLVLCKRRRYGSTAVSIYETI